MKILSRIFRLYIKLKIILIQKVKNPTYNYFFLLRFNFKIFTFLILSFLTFSAEASSGRGYVEIAKFDPNKQVLLLSGWAAPESPNVYTSNIIVYIDHKKIYQGRFLRSVRQDVVAETQRADWLWSGWQLDASTFNILPGTHELKVEFLLTDGATFSASSIESTQSIHFPPKSQLSKKSILFLLLAFIFPAVAFLLPSNSNRRLIRMPNPITVFLIAVILSFFSLIASGLTGSSVRLALKDTSLLVHDAVPWQGQARDVRMDEWHILTQMATGQINAVPQFPVLNRNVGIDSNNMLLIGMTGVPVSHVSTLAKPATWGFWLFDMRTALAWHWWFPFFGCFLALWAALIRFLKIDWRIAAVLALTIPASPYSVVFSGHPAYIVFFPVLCLWLLDRILSQNRLIIAAPLGALMGLSLAGFVLVLYLPWQITLLYLLVPLGASYLISQYKLIRFDRIHLLSIIIAIIVFSGLIGSWYIDTKDALQIVADTVYPGQRDTSVGGDIDPWFMIKGYLSPMVMYHEIPFMGASDAGSFMWLWLPLLISSGLTFWNSGKFYSFPIVIIGFIAVALIYIYIGFPKPLAAFTLWGRVTSYRLDLALGLAQLFLLGWLLSAKNLGYVRIGELMVTRVAITMGLVVAFLSIWMFTLLPVPIADIFSPGYFLIASGLIGFVSYLIIQQKHAMAITIYCAWMVGAAWSFNPVDLAPSRVDIDPALKSALQSQRKMGQPTRIAVLDTHLWRMNLVAAGEPVVNAVLYYPQPTLWKTLDPDGKNKLLYNRYQNLEFSTAELPGSNDHKIDSPRLDLVSVTLDPKRFDFRKLGATHLLTSPQTATSLTSNNSVQQVAANGHWVLLAVKAAL